MNEIKPKVVAYAELTLLALGLALFLWWVSPVSVPEVSLDDESLATTSKMTLFPDVELEAKSAYVYDVANRKVLFQKDPELVRPLASLTKLMSAVTAASLVPEYMLVKITREDMREEGDTGLFVDEEWNIQKLIDYTLVVSSNDGMRAIASVAGSQIIDETESSPEVRFVNEMNKKAQEIGLIQTHFLNQSGLDVTETLSGGYGSAKDMTMLVDYILGNNPHLLEATAYDKLSISSNDSTHSAMNTNKAILGIPNVLGSKTGYTALSGGNVMVAWNAGLDHPIIVTVLGSSYDGRFEDLSKLVDSTLVYLSKAPTTVITIPQRIK